MEEHYRTFTFFDLSNNELVKLRFKRESRVVVSRRERVALPDGILMTIGVLGAGTGAAKRPRPSPILYIQAPFMPRPGSPPIIFQLAARREGDRRYPGAKLMRKEMKASGKIFLRHENTGLFFVDTYTPGPSSQVIPVHVKVADEWMPQPQ